MPSSIQTQHGSAVAPQLHREELAALALRYARGERNAFGALYHGLRGLIERTITGVLGADEVSQDLIQEVFLKAHVARRHCLTRPSLTDAEVRAWYRIVARNTALSHLRQHYRRPADNPLRRDPSPDTLPGRDDGPEAAIVDAEADASRRQQVHTALRALSAQSRELILLHKLQAVPMRQVASRLGITPGAARVRAHRAYRKMRLRLERTEAEPRLGGAR